MLAGRAIISVQNPLRLDSGSEPQPDVMVLRQRADDYDTAAPNAGDVLVVIEVADGSLAEDRAVQAPLYAESGITEYCIANLAERVVEVCRQPERGCYVDVRRVGADGVLDFAMLPGVVLPAAELLRPVGR
jgi:Uma2 family endonuclease